jgi:hypothetical protein
MRLFTWVTRGVQAFTLAFSGYLLILPDAAIHTGFYSRRPGNLVFGGKALIILFIILLGWMQWRLVVVQQHREKITVQQVANTRVRWCPGPHLLDTAIITSLICDTHSRVPW